VTATWLHLAVLILLGAPTFGFAALAIPAWVGWPLPERWTTRVLGGAYGVGFAAALAAAAGMLVQGVAEVRVPLGIWFAVDHYRFQWDLILDGLSLPFSLLVVVLVALISVFSRRYLHRDPGFTRFYVLLALLGAGVETVVLAGSLDVVVVGWELVGIASTLLIAFFNTRPAPVRHGLRAFITYRLCDIGLLGATVWLHHAVGSTAFASSDGRWAGLLLPPGAADAAIVGSLLVLAILGKSAQFPLGGWLPRAMEGPTPSSAIFYGALAIHLGPFLLLRAAPYLDGHPVVSGAVVLIGLLTALHATLTGRVQSDIKSALAYASMTQVGLIVGEVGLGWHGLAVVHAMGHACIRTLQFLRSPSLLHDHHHLEQAMGSHLPRAAGHLENLLPAAWRPWLYRLALERGYLDSLLQDHLVGGCLRAVRAWDRIEQRWVAFLAVSRPSDAATDIGRDGTEVPS
jgi:NADH:ubiquinone oxidoreductase subunit 5 (subunit L)/multisubunit Na+/H+ antiporter MnhA subunit